MTLVGDGIWLSEAKRMSGKWPTRLRSRAECAAAGCRHVAHVERALAKLNRPMEICLLNKEITYLVLNYSRISEI